MNRLALWLGIAAIALGLAVIVRDYFAGRGFEPAGLLAVAVGLVVVSVAVVATRNGTESGG